MSGGNPIERLVRAAEDAADDDPRATNFARGLVLGALVGAAIAGSTIWQRRHAKVAPVGSAPALPPEPPAPARDAEQTLA